jgi:predicted glutamine amidotransferase
MRSLFSCVSTFGLSYPPYSPKLVEEAFAYWCSRHGIEHPIRMTVATSDGKNVWGFRYSSEVQSRTLYYGTNVRTLREMYPDRPCLQEVSDETRIIVSEPLVELAGVWKEVPESSYGLVCEGEDELRTFQLTR